MTGTFRGALVAGALLAHAIPVAGQQPPRWASLEGIALGTPIDNVLARDASCMPAMIGATSESAAQAAELLFGYALPHRHVNPEAALAALAPGTICRLALWSGEANALVFATNRRIHAVNLMFTSREGTLSIDSTRRLLRAAWGRGSGVESLEQWEDSRYRAWLLVPYGTDDRRSWRITFFDVQACNEFEQRVHRAGEPGQASTC